MDDDFTRFDMNRKPDRQMRILCAFIRLVSFFELRKHKEIIKKVNTETLKAPYVLLCNHNAFYDFFVASACTFPARANYVVAIDGFTTPKGKNGFGSREFIMRKAGCICKRKFTSDIRLVRQLKDIIDNGDVAVIYPEARYSLCGTNAVLPESLGKLCKVLKAPVATLICHGHHLNSPFWHLGDKKLHTEAEFTQIITADEIGKMSAEEIFSRIREKFIYDDFTWVKEHKIRINAMSRAQGLHKVLYQCPACGTEYKMGSSGSKLFCNACHKTWNMDIFGELKAEAGETEFAHVPDWYEWERMNVRREVEDGTYSFSSPCHVASLPNSKGYIDLGTGTLVHDMNGFRVTVSGKYGEFTMTKPVSSLYSCHIEYDYLGKYGDCVDLNTLEDTWYTYPDCEEFSVTKMALATEELYDHEKKKKPVAKAM